MPEWCAEKAYPIGDPQFAYEFDRNGVREGEREIHKFIIIVLLNPIHEKASCQKEGTSTKTIRQRYI
jgi:hypothetical protein